MKLVKKKDEESEMKNKEEKKISIEAKILAAILAGLLIFGSVAGVLMYIFL